MSTKLRREPLDVLYDRGSLGIGVGALGCECSMKGGPGKFPQAFAAFGHRLAQPLIEAGLAYMWSENGSKWVSITEKGRRKLLRTRGPV